MKAPAFLAAFVLAAAPALASTVWIPGAAHADGVAGTTWRTEVWLTNTNADDASATWLAFASGESACIRPEVVPPAIDVPAGDTVRLVDPLDEVSAHGFLELGLPAGVLARAETFNAVEGGKLGQSLPLWTSGDLTAAGATIALPGGRRDATFRTNLIVFIGDAACALDIDAIPVTVRLRGAGGESLASAEFAAPNFGQLAIFDVFAKLGATECRRCRIDVTTTTAFSAFLSLVDNRTGDPTPILPRE